MVDRRRRFTVTPPSTTSTGEGSCRISRFRGVHLVRTSRPRGSGTGYLLGDLFRVGSAVLQITQPRIPCYKLQLRFNRDDIIKRFLVSGRSEFYFSVIEPGDVGTGSKVEAGTPIASRSPTL